MLFDIHTLAIVLSLSSLAQWIALFAQHRVDRTSRGPGWWSLGAACSMGAFACNYLRDSPSLGTAAIAADNSLLCWSAASIYVGVVRFFGRTERRAPLIALCAADTLLTIYFTYVRDDLNLRRVVTAIAIGVISFGAAWTFYQSKLPATRASARFLGGLFIANAVLIAVTTTGTVRGPAPVSGFGQDGVHVAFYLGTLVLSTLWTFGLIIMVSQRLIAERQATIGELNAAMEQITTLRGILPICTNCKKIRDDAGYWRQVEGYISQHTQAAFTHGICPDCARRLYAKFQS